MVLWIFVLLEKCDSNKLDTQEICKNVLCLYSWRNKNLDHLKKSREKWVNFDVNNPNVETMMYGRSSILHTVSSS